MTRTRRDVLAAASALTGGAFLLGPLRPVAAQDAPGQELRALPAGSHEVAPLPFDPGKLVGLSERLLVSHHDNNYAGAVRNLNKVELSLAEVTKDTAPFEVAGLRQAELGFTNSLILHETYFGNLGGDGKASGAIESALAAMHGSLAHWEEQFRATAAGLYGGSGWVVLDFQLQSGDLRIHAAGHHTQSVAAGVPLLVLDMYEHAYALDYGASAAQYVDAFFRNVDWEVVDARLARASAAYAALTA